MHRMKRKHHDNSTFFNKDHADSAVESHYDHNNSQFESRKRYHGDRYSYTSDERESQSYNAATPARNVNNPAIHDDECHSYFKNALDTLKQGIDDDQKDVFVANVLEQTIGQELQLSSQSVSSRCIEHLLELSNDLVTITRFMQAFSTSKEDAFGNPFASHITEALLYLGLRHLQNWSKDIEPDGESEESCSKAEQVLAVLTWIQNLGEFCLENLKTCLEDNNAAPVLRTLIQALGGHYVCQAVNQSKRAKEHKKYFEHEYLGEDYDVKQKESVALAEVPKFFVDVLKRLSKAFLKLEDIKTYAIEARTCGVVTSFLYVLKRRLPKRSKKFVRKLMEIIFDKQNKQGVPLALLHKNCSFVVEKVFEAALDNLQDEIWNEQIRDHLEYLVSHPVGNFVVQRLFSAVENKTLFESMTESTMKLFPVVFNARSYGIFQSIATSCNRLKSQQGPFMTHMMKCLQCEETEERQLQIAPLLLGLETFDVSAAKRNDHFVSVTLQGSLLVQSVLKFQKPIKVVRSILGMKPDELKFLACHIQGCHVLTAFLDSEFVGEKNKDKFLQHFKVVLVPLACDRGGSLTLSRMWVLLSLKQKGVIAEELSKHEKTLRDNQSGSLLLKKFGVFHFKKKYDQWVEFQQNITKKRHSND